MALRKLQAEIDRTLKAVAQGVEVFESTFDKLNNSTNATQKDKLETDLKTQIKKLQRMRDQIKVWLGSSDIKDKSALLDNRKLIETQMERFKALEKEMKMKAFSKEGLIAAARLDPVEKARRDMQDWINSTIEELSRQIEQTEAEQELLQSVKKKKSTGDRMAELEQLNERRQWHIGRLEIVQRMFENGQISLEDVESIQEDVKYFVEANTEEDFDYDTGIYDELNLQDVEDEYIGDFGHHEDESTLDSASVADLQETKTPLKEDKKSRSSHRSTTGDDDAPSSPVLTKRSKKLAEKEEKEKAKAAAAAAKAAADATPPPPPETSVPVPKAAPLPPIRYAAAAAAAVGAPLSETTPPAHSKDMPPSPPVEDTPIHEEDSTPPPEPHTNGHPPPPGLSPSPSPSLSPSPALAEPLLQPQPQQPQQQQPQMPQFHAESSRANYPRGKEQGVLESLMDSFHSAKELAERRTNDPNELSNALDASFQNVPAQVDAEPPRYYHPSNPIQTPSYYPQARLPALEDKTIYQRLELDQLFYIFYYMTGTYEQWLAAQELKRQSWRFHKQYLTWFQRAHNPQAITEDYEQGGYYYFDWENSWCQRRKSDFRFEYRWLSDH